MRKLNINDMYLLSEIADKMDFKLPDMAGKDNAQFGAEIFMLIFKNIYKAKQEINDLISDVTGKNALEMNMKEIKDTIKKIFSQDGVVDFFK